MRKKAALIILDGWGVKEDSESNAITTASTPVWDALLKRYPHTTLQASEEHIGLPKGQMGNSEVGHMTIGGGRVLLQDLERINRYIKSFGFFKHKAFLDSCFSLQKSGKSYHLMGLASPGGVHAHTEHILALCEVLNSFDIKIYLHLFLDGRDTPPESAYRYIEELESRLPKLATIATLGGRYYGMDRDKRWDRVEKAYLAMVDATGPIIPNPLEYIQSNYKKGVTDEFMIPVVIEGYGGIQEGDAFLCFNFRADRVRQILEALLEEKFKEFNRSHRVNFSFLYGMKSYSSTLDKHMNSLFSMHSVEDGLGEVLSKAKCRQLRLAETEKYAHVTFFFNGGKEKPFSGEDRILISSPKVETYDLQPEMAAAEVTDVFVKAVKEGRYDLIIINYANTDMVGHTGNFKATCKAVEMIDSCLGRVYDSCQKEGVDLFITADHGNAEQMLDNKTHSSHTAHTCNLVPFVFVPSKKEGEIVLKRGGLEDIAPTILSWLKINKPEKMTGKTLFSD